MFNFIKNNSQESVQTPLSQNNYVQGEITESKKTSTVGIFLLFIMIITGIYQGNNLFDYLKTYISKPEPVSSYYRDYKSIFAEKDNLKHDNYYLYDYNFSAYDAADKISSSEKLIFRELYREDESKLLEYYSDLEDQNSKIKKLYTEIQEKENNIRDLDRKKNDEQSYYNTTLLEDIANKNNSVFDQNISVNFLSSYNNELENVIKEKDILSEKKKEEQNYLNNLLNDKKDFWGNSVLDKYKNEYFVYTLKVFLLSVLLIAPVFYFVYSKYKSQKDQNSEYSVIWGAGLIIFSVFLLQILWFFVYNILPSEFIGTILEFFDSELFVFMLQLLGAVGMPFAFGFVVYKLQKKYYNSDAVKMRAIKSGVCPHCSMKIMNESNNCPVCGFSIKNKCSNCGNMKYNFGSFCDKCGNKNN